MLPETFTPQLLRQLELLRIRARRAFLGTRQGGHISLKRGHGIEFSDFRKYELGDDPRHIDWNVYARSERLYVKRFQEEQDLAVFLFLDSTASMHNPPGDRKWERARDIALGLAYVALLQQDSVTIAVPGVWHSPRFSGGKAVHQIAKALENPRLSEATKYNQAMDRAVSQVHFPGVAFFISDFLMPLKDIQRYFAALRARNLDICAIQVLGPNDLNPLPQQEQVVAIDSENGEEVELVLTPEERKDYGYALAEHNRVLREFLAENGISCISAETTQSLSDFMANNLAGTGLLQ